MDTERNMQFDRRLSLAIDAVHHELDSLHGRTGLRAWARRMVLRLRLRRLERAIP